MTCEEFDRLLSDFVSGKRGKEDVMREHAEQCGRCRKIFRKIKKAEEKDFEEDLEIENDMIDKDHEDLRE